MKKRYWIPVLVLLVLVTAISAVGFWLDDIAKAAVERGGQAAMGVPTTVDETALNLLGGSLLMQGFEIDNPEGFETPHFLAIGKIACGFSLANLFEESVVIPQLTIENLEIWLEKGSAGENYRVILDRMKKPADEPPPAEEEAAGKKLVIREVVVKDVVAHAVVTVAGEKLTSVDVPIEEIRLQDVGSGAAGGMAYAPLLATIVKATLEAVIASGHEVLPDTVVAGVGIGLRQAGELLNERALEAMEAAGVDPSQLGIEEAIDKGMKSAVERLEGVLGGKQKAEKEKEKEGKPKDEDR